LTIFSTASALAGSADGVPAAFVDPDDKVVSFADVQALQSARRHETTRSARRTPGQRCRTSIAVSSPIRRICTIAMADTPTVGDG
jgi:hypothetical protein